MKNEIEPILVDKKRTKELLGGLSLRSIDYLIAGQLLETRVLGRRRLIVYRSVVAFAKRDHPGPLAGDHGPAPDTDRPFNAPRPPGGD